MKAIPRSRLTLAFIVLLLTSVSEWAQQLPVRPEKTLPQVTIQGSELRTLRSSATGRGYDVYVFLPGGYGKDVSKKYPVVYALDGQWDFKLLASVYGGLYYDKFVPEIILVGITYTGANPNYDALRAMDYTPVPEVRLTGSGDAPKFLTFLRSELFPFIESNYRVDPARRVLLGSSLGGLFALYAMFSEPQLFNGYVAASPAVTYGDRFSFKQEAAYAAKHKDLRGRLFISVGEIEELTQPVKEFMTVINGRGYSGLKMESRIIEGERHSGNKPEAFNRGLRFVFGAD